MKLEKQPKMTKRKKKRVGRGYGSGKGGHTVGRGAKGRKARGKVPLMFTGTKTKKSFVKKLPFQRGKGKFKSLKPGPVIVDVKFLALLPTGKVVDRKVLIKHKMVKEKEVMRFGVKILGNTPLLKKKYKVNLPCSKGAASVIKKAGGEVIWSPKKGKEKVVKAEKKGKKKKKEKKKAKKRAVKKPKAKAEEKAKKATKSKKTTRKTAKKTRTPKEAKKK